jgi:hypothetical protein
MAKKLLSDEARFFRSIEKMPDGCWRWLRAKDKDQYGLFKIGSHKDGTRRMARAHRWAYEHFVGPIGDGLTIDHLCRNHPCVNPAHMEPVTSAVNTKRGARATATHCRLGHPFSGSNLLIFKSGKRRCKECSI